MKDEIKNKIMEKLDARDFTVGLGSQGEAHYLCGAMEMYLLLNPESKADGTWCPPSWVIPILSGDSPLQPWRNKQ